jgi:hypothetical protein
MKGGWFFLGRGDKPYRFHDGHHKPSLKAVSSTLRYKEKLKRVIFHISFAIFHFVICFSVTSVDFLVGLSKESLNSDSWANETK